MSSTGAPPRRRVRWGWRRIHKWLAVAAGTVLMVWIITGIFISIPGGGTPGFSQLRPALDLETASVSPAEALATLEAAGFAEERVRTIQLRFLGSRPAYTFQVAGSGPILIDARTAQRIEIDAGEALRMVSEFYGGGGEPSEPELVTTYDARFFVGTLPAYRIDFGDELGTAALVAVTDGSITWWDRRSRTRRLMSVAHDWWPLGRLVSPRFRLLALFLAGGISLAATLTGYWLALRRKRRRA